MDNVPASSRRAWAAAVTLIHAHGNTLAAIMTMAETKTGAIVAALSEAEKSLPPGTGESFAILNSHATPIDPAVVRAAADELAPTGEPANG